MEDDARQNENIQLLKTIRNSQQQKLTSLSSERAKQQQELEQTITKIDIDERKKFLEMYKKNNEILRIKLSIIKGDDLLRDVKYAVSGKTSPTILLLKAQDKPLAIRKAELIREWLNLHGQNGTIPNDLRKKYSANHDVSNMYEDEVSRDYNFTHENTLSRIFARPKAKKRDVSTQFANGRGMGFPSSLFDRSVRQRTVRRDYEDVQRQQNAANRAIAKEMAVQKNMQRVLAPLQKEYRGLQASWNATKRRLRKCMVGAAVGACAIAAIPHVQILGLEILRRAYMSYRFLTADSSDPAFRAVLLRYQNQ
jgi:hypothetical protein